MVVSLLDATLEELENELRSRSDRHIQLEANLVRNSRIGAFLSQEVIDAFLPGHDCITCRFDGDTITGCWNHIPRCRRCAMILFLMDADGPPADTVIEIQFREI